MGLFVKRLFIYNLTINKLLATIAFNSKEKLTLLFIVKDQLNCYNNYRLNLRLYAEIKGDRSHV